MGVYKKIFVKIFLGTFRSLVFHLSVLIQNARNAVSDSLLFQNFPGIMPPEPPRISLLGDRNPQRKFLVTKLLLYICILITLVLSSPLHGDITIFLKYLYTVLFSSPCIRGCMQVPFTSIFHKYMLLNNL